MINTATLPSESQFSTGWVTCRLLLGEEVQSLDYHEEKDVHVLGTSRKADFKLPEDEFHREWSAESKFDDYGH